MINAELHSVVKLKCNPNERVGKYCYTVLQSFHGMDGRT